MSAPDIEAADREPAQLDDFNEVTHPGRTETYYRCGYVIAGGKPVMVDEFARDAELARKRAEFIAKRVRNDLVKLRAPADVSVWFQRWQSERSTIYDTAEVIAI
jgi:nucleoside 2-deoxyribosyltransferase